jgi:hypothetical protein
VTDLLARTIDCAARIRLCLAASPRIVAELLIWRWSLPLLKRWLSVETLARLMTPRTADGLSAEARRAHTATVHRILTTGGRVLVSTHCLERSLVAYRLFTRAGADVALVLGMRREGSTLAGHSWVELNGRSLDNPDAGQYTRIATIRAHDGTPGIERATADALPPF